MHFYRDELYLSNKGLKNNLQPNRNKKQITNKILDLETTIQKDQPENQENLRQITKKYGTYITPPKDMHTKKNSYNTT